MPDWLLIIILIPVMLLPIFWMALFVLTCLDYIRCRRKGGIVEPTPENLKAEGWQPLPSPRGIELLMIYLFLWPIFLVPTPRRRGT